MEKRKVFGVGLSKTGTTSLTAALKRLGYKATHYPNLFSVIETAREYDAVTDTPVIVFMEALDRLFPRAQFILTVRHEGEWLDSCRRHYARKAPRQMKGWQRWNRRCVFGIHGFDEDVFRQVRLVHTLRVKRLFAGRHGKLLVMNVCAGDGYDVLCPFLGLPVIDESFPHRNKGRERE